MNTYFIADFLSHPMKGQSTKGRKPSTGREECINTAYLVHFRPRKNNNDDDDDNNDNNDNNTNINNNNNSQDQDIHVKTPLQHSSPCASITWQFAFQLRRLPVTWSNIATLSCAHSSIIGGQCGQISRPVPAFHVLHWLVAWES